MGEAINSTVKPPAPRQGATPLTLGFPRAALANSLALGWIPKALSALILEADAAMPTLPQGGISPISPGQSEASPWAKVRAKVDSD